MIEPLTQPNTKRFQVALSFAGEHRNFVEGVAEQLSRNLGQNRVFYDRYYEAELARPNLDTYLIKIYREDTDLIAIFLCPNYTQKEWCGLEWRAVRDVLQNRPGSEVMPFKFDEVTIEGLLSIDGYIAINNRTPEDVACLILQRIDGKDTLSLHTLESKSLVACDEIDLVLDVDFEAFTPEREHRLVRALSLLLQDADVRIRRKRPGNSTILTLDLTSQQWNILKEAIERGELAEFKPKELLVNGVSVIAPQSSIMALATPAARPTVADTVIKARREHMNIQSILATKGAHVITIRPEQAIREALVLFIRHNIGALVVLDDAGQLIGILSERDIIRAVPMNEAIFSQLVSEVMTREIITAVPQDDLMSVANTMTELRIRHLPVVDQGRLVGIVSIGDVVKAQRDQYHGEVDTLQTQLLTDAI